MAVVSSSVEIVETIEEVNSKSEINEATSSFLLDSESKYSIEDDINRLFESLNVRSSHRTSGLSRDAGRDSLRKNPSKRPMRGGSSPASGIGISEPVSLKQALRGLCISQASEMAAMKRLAKPTNLSSISEAGNIKRLYRAMVVEAGKSGHPLNEGKANVVEISLLPEKIASSSSEKVSDSTQNSCSKLLHQTIPPPPTAEAVTAEGTMDGLMSVAPDLSSPIDPGSCAMKSECANISSLESSSVNHGSHRVSDACGFPLPAADVPFEHLESNNEHKGKLPLPSSLSSSIIGNTGTKTTLNSPRLFRPVFGNKNLNKKKLKHESCSASSSHNRCMEKVNGESDKSNLESNIVLNREGKEDGKTSLASSSAKQSNEVSSTFMSMGINKPFSALTCSNGSKSFCKADEKSRPRDKGDFSQSSKSSIGEYSSSTSISETSNASSSSSFGNRPHMSKDLRWEAIQSVQKQHGNINLRHFKLLKRLGSGDIGKIYLAELIGTDCLFALKLMDNEFLVTRKKMPRAQTEKDIMQMLDHPFLPTLYCHFSTDKLSGLVMEYCPGGDLHVLRQKQPARSFSEQAARFYVAEVLLALEYLHMLGVVYRDLKPENILVREDGHIMLSDFDLSLRCAVNPTLVAAASPDVEREPTRKSSSPCTESSCVDPFCLNPSFQVPCFTPRLLSVGTRSRKMKSDLASQSSSLPQVVVEPTSARSNSFVGTHEYIAPEIIKGEGHGSAVDWWTFGILLYELLYGRTPFKGSGNEETLSNVVSRSLKFPSNPVVSFHARDLIRGLLIKEPENRLGSVRGAAEIKQHPFFEGLNWALIRCAVPPEMPKLNEVEISAPSSQKETRECKETQQTLEHVEFEVF